MTNIIKFEARKRTNGTVEVNLFGEIGSDVTSAAFIERLQSLQPYSHVIINVNSPGGSVVEGNAIYNFLQRSTAYITVRIEGIAASMASVIVMAADKIIMPDNALMMIHDPSGSVTGGADDLRQRADLIDRFRSSMLTAYVTRTKLPRERVESMMAAETWLSAADAVKLGFADEVEGAVAIAATFDLSRFRHAPKIATGPAALIDAKTKTLNVTAIYQKWNAPLGK